MNDDKDTWEYRDVDADGNAYGPVKKLLSVRKIGVFTAALEAFQMDIEGEMRVERVHGEGEQASYAHDNTRTYDFVEDSEICRVRMFATAVIEYRVAGYERMAK